jgi:hypothetical protein
MTTVPQVVDPEFVVHLFAPVEGPAAERAFDLIRAVWASCERKLGTTVPIPGTGVPTEPPAAPTDPLVTEVLAAGQRPDSGVQMVLRQERDVLNLSAAFATWSSEARSFPLGEASPSWTRWDQLWSSLLGDQTEVLLGEARLYLAQLAGAEQPALARALLPALPSTRVSWPEHAMVTGKGLAAWEFSPGSDVRALRRIVVLAPLGNDTELSAWTWSRGDPAMPPFARYLMHAAKLRYELRVWDDGRQTDLLRQRANTNADLVHALLDPVRATEIAEALAVLRTDEADVVRVLADVREMRHTVHIAAANMSTVTEGCGSGLAVDDRRLAEWFELRLGDAVTYLETVAERLRRLRTLAGELVPTPARQSRPLGSQYRMLFAVDIVGYSTQTAWQQQRFQRRLRDIVEEVLHDLAADIPDRDRRDTGDGWIIYLPVGHDPTRVLPTLIRATADRITMDNKAERPKLRLRVAIGTGLLVPGRDNASGAAIVEVVRLLDSDALRSEISDHRDTDIAVIVSDRLYTDVTAAGNGGVSADEFHRVRAIAKNFDAFAWLWRPAARIEPT